VVRTLRGEIGELDDYEQHRLRPFKWDSDAEGFGPILAAGGFDAVIGNPPYFSVDNAYGAGHPVPAYLQRAYPAVWDRMTDVYYYFLAKGVELAKDRVGFIVSRAFLEAHYAAGIRGVLSPNMWEAFDNSIGRLPIRRISFENPADVEAHNRVVVSQTPSRTLSAQRLKALPRRIAPSLHVGTKGLSDELNAVVLDLYGITDQADRADVLRFGAPL